MNADKRGFRSAESAFICGKSRELALVRVRLRDGSRIRPGGGTAPRRVDEGRRRRRSRCKAGKLTGDGFGRSLLTLKILTTEGKDKYCHYLQVKLGAK